ncbi:terminase small subunit [Prauserella shujinwangii]|uniref:terminase small subunit n=1 Tax=Prauserella shujinwangii TaxID=1453103 RepID=UPI003CCBBF52
MEHSPQVTAELEKALQAMEFTDKDRAAVAMARRLAVEMDMKLGNGRLTSSKLLEVLVELGMTPKSRAAIAAKSKEQDQNVGNSKLDELRARRAARSHGT